MPVISHKKSCRKSWSWILFLRLTLKEGVLFVTSLSNLKLIKLMHAPVQVLVLVLDAHMSFKKRLHPPPWCTLR